MQQQLQIEHLNPHDLLSHPDNRPGGLKEDHIEKIAQSIRDRGYDEDYYVKYTIPGDDWPSDAPYAALKGKRVLLGGHHRVQAAIRAGLTTIPAKLKQMRYFDTLEFLDYDNNSAELTWFERALLHEKRRKLLNLSPEQYGKGIAEGTSGRHYGRISKTVSLLLEAGIGSSDIEGLGQRLVEKVVTHKSVPSADLRGIFAALRAGTISANNETVQSVLTARYPGPTKKGSGPKPSPTVHHLYIATSPFVPNLIKAGTTTEDPAKYVAKNGGGTWSPGYALWWSIDVPAAFAKQADAMMKTRLGEGWPGIREFYRCSPEQAKSIILKIAAHFAEADAALRAPKTSPRPKTPPVQSAAQKPKSATVEAMREAVRMVNDAKRSAEKKGKVKGIPDTEKKDKRPKRMDDDALRRVTS